MREIPAQALRNDAAYAVCGFKFELAGGDPARHGTRSLPSKDIESAIFAVPYVVGERVRRLGARGIGQGKGIAKNIGYQKDDEDLWIPAISARNGVRARTALSTEKSFSRIVTRRSEWLR